MKAKHSLVIHCIVTYLLWILMAGAKLAREEAEREDSDGAESQADGHKERRKEIRHKKSTVRRKR
eukprot:11243331-Ditylum_brightwellii.AAC.1